MNKSRISSQNRRLHRRTACISKAPVKRSLNHVVEVELNFVGFRCIRESIKRLLRCGFNTFDDSDDSVNLRLIDQPPWSIDEQTNVFVKLDIRRTFWVNHCMISTLLIAFHLFFSCSISLLSWSTD